MELLFIICLLLSVTSLVWSTVINQMLGHNLPTQQIQKHFEKGEYGRDENHPCRKYYGHFPGYNYPYNQQQYAQFHRRLKRTEATVGEENIGEDEVAGAPRHHYPKEDSEEFKKEELAWQEEEAEEEEEKKEEVEERRQLFTRARTEANEPQGLTGPPQSPGAAFGGMQGMGGPQSGQDMKMDSSGGFISSSGQRYMINPMYSGYGGYPGYPGYGGYPYGGYPYSPYTPFGMHPCSWHGGFYPFAGLPPLHGYAPDSVNAIHSAIHKMSPSSPFNISTSAPLDVSFPSVIASLENN